MNANVAAGEGECIDTRVVDHEKGEVVITVVCLRGNTVADIVDVFINLWIFDELPTHAYVAHDRATDLCLGGFAQNGIGRAAQIGNLNIVRTGTGDEYDRRKGEKQQGAFAVGNNQQ